jgi:hypothetical protein
MDEEAFVFGAFRLLPAQRIRPSPTTRGAAVRGLRQSRREPGAGSRSSGLSVARSRGFLESAGRSLRRRC